MLHRDASAKWIVFAAALAVIGAGLLLILNFKSDTVNVHVGDTTIVADVADSPDEHARGLSETTELTDAEGMLFVFEHEGVWGMWMKSMRYNLDIIWLDESKKVVDIATDVAPGTYPQSFEPKTPAKYALEVPGGFTARHRVGLGDFVSFRSWVW